VKQQQIQLWLSETDP